MPDTAAPQRNVVHMGEPISHHQAATAVLKLIKSSILGDITLDPSPGYTLERIFKTQSNGSGSIYDMLSSGEKKLVGIAQSIWTQSTGADISVLGGLDHDMRRKVLIILMYTYLAKDLDMELTPEEYGKVFGIKAVTCNARHALHMRRDDCIEPKPAAL